MTNTWEMTSATATPLSACLASGWEEITSRVELRAFATAGLREDVLAALGEPASATETAVISGLFSVRPDDTGEGDGVTLSVASWEVEARPNGTLDFDFSSAPAAAADAPARHLYEAMRGATVSHVITIVGENVTHRSPKGRVACTLATSFHQGEGGYTCRITGLTGLTT